MNPRQQLVRRRRNDRAGVDRAAILLPTIPDSRKSEGSSVAELKIVRLRDLAVPLPQGYVDILYRQNQYELLRASSAVSRGDNLFDGKDTPCVFRRSTPIPDTNLHCSTTKA